MTRLILTTATAALIGGPALAAGPDAMAELTTSEGQPAGHVEIRQARDGTIFHAELQGLPAGWHSFHVHEAGSCKDGFKAAGGHYAPAGHGHGLMAEGGAHAGDLPNIHVHQDGTARAEFHSARLNVTGGEAPLMDEDGSAIVIHAQPDSYGSEAGAGARIACGVIAKPQ